MDQKLKFLILEDVPTDAELIENELQKAGMVFCSQRVETKEDFIQEIENDPPDVILSDYNLPHFDGMLALKSAKEMRPDVPFIFVSGSIGEEFAIAAVKQGATDYVLKDQLFKLVPVIERALKEVADRTARKNLENQLRLAQRLEAIGRLAGGIAHDFNNLMTVIIGRTDLMLLNRKKDDPLYSDVVEIKKAGEKATSLTRQLLAFSRKQMLMSEVVNLNTMIVETAKMLRRLIGEDIELITVLDQELGQVKVDPSQIEQVIINLVINSRDAMPKGGKLTIETVNVYLDEQYTLKHIQVKPGSYVMLATSDTGVGMDEETQSHIFEPFFTTKEKNKGTGLGLSTAYGVVKQSGGYIWVYSEPNKGTTFKIYLPRVKEKSERVEEKPSPVTLLRGSETILVVEDNEMVCSLAQSILQLYGYTVLQAKDGPEALRMSGEFNGPIHLMLTDVVMPQMSGNELANCLVSSRPEMKVLFMSGYTDSAIVHHGVLDRDKKFLQKPFTGERLARKVREVLDA